MITSRAKFNCLSCTLVKTSSYNPETKQYNPIIAKSWKFQAVTGGSNENSKFFASTPHGIIEINIVNPEVHFELGEDYYVDFTHSNSAS